MSYPLLTFITGTDTGVGKTVATALLLRHWRAAGIQALAMKPFCSGDRGDVAILQRLQPGALSDDEVNPFFFAWPLAPWVAARRARRQVTLEAVLQKIQMVTPRCERLLIEGCGGWLTPLGPGFTLAEMVAALGGNLVVVAPNKLGVVNHALLTFRALPKRAKSRAKLLLMEQAKRDMSARSNPQALRELLRPNEVFCLPFLGRKPFEMKNLQKKRKKIKKVLACLED